MEIHACASQTEARAVIHYITSAGVAIKRTIAQLKDVGDAVVAAQIEIAGSGTGIVDSLIRLEVYNLGAPVRLQS